MPVVHMEVICIHNTYESLFDKCVNAWLIYQLFKILNINYDETNLGLTLLNL